jgi:hypothetical protein
MLAPADISRTLLLGAAILVCGAGCAALVGADFDVSARPVSDAGEHRILPSSLISAPDGNTRLLGLSVAVDGDTALVGARDPDWSGHVLVVTRRPGGAWEITAQLTAEQYAAPSTQFGSSVALSGDWAIIGAKGSEFMPNPGPGAAYFFHRASGGWTLAQAVKAPAPTSGDKFGSRVAIEDGLAVVGAPGESNAGTVVGSAYTYTLGADQTWAGPEVLAAENDVAGDEFGAEVALRLGRLVVSAPSADAAGVDSGIVYVFDRSAGSWQRGQRLVPEAGDAGGFLFGDGTIGLDEHALIVPGRQISAYKTDSTGTWVPDALEPPPGLASPTLAWRAAVRGDTAIVAVRTPDDLGVGLVYRRKAGAWAFDERLESGTDYKDVFGWTVAFDGTTACFGAIFYRDQEGAAYFFNL